MNNRKKGVVTCEWKPKSKLERNLSIALIVLVILFIALLLFVIIKPNVTKKKCVSPVCLTAASQIMSRLNTDEDPCQNFYKFACGNFKQGAKTPVAVLKENVEKHVMDIVNEPINDTDHYLINMQKDLYQSCLNQTMAETSVLQILNSTVNELGWPVVIGYQWREEAFDWQQLIFQLRRKGLPFQMMLSFEVIPENSTYLLRIDSPQLNRVTDSITVYKKYMTEIAVLFGAEERRAVIEMEKVFDFMENLYKVSEKNLDINIYTVRELQEENGDIDWLHFLNTILYPVKHLSMDDYIQVPSQQFTTDFFNIIYRTPKRIIANYIIWNCLENFIQYMPENFRNLRKNYECQVNDVYNENRSDFCKQNFKYFFPVPSEIMMVKKYLPKRRHIKVKEIVKNIKNQLKVILTGTRWMDDTSRSMSLEKLDNTLDVIGAPFNYFDDFYLDQFVWPGQHNKTIQKGGFFDKLLQVIHMHQNNIFYKLQKREERSETDLLYTLTKQVNAHYCRECNSIILPVGILQDIFYEENRPMYLNYGAIGSGIGHEFTHGFVEDGRHYGKLGYPEDIWSNATINSYTEAIQCMIDDFQNYNGKSLQLSRTLEENLADYTGIRLAYSAYQQWVQDNGDENQLVGVPYTPNQLFWISSISHQCFVSPSNGNVHADGEFRTIAPLRNTEHFAKDFECPENSPMNPRKKCQVL